MSRFAGRLGAASRRRGAGEMANGPVHAGARRARRPDGTGKRYETTTAGEMATISGRKHMRKQYFYIAGVAASALALGLLGMPASGSVSGRPTPSMLHVVRQPVINKKLVQTKTAPTGLPLFTSGNWAGYIALTGGSTTSYKEVQSDYTVPSVNCNSVGTGDGFAYHWVGLDGWSSGTVEQDGVAGLCQGGSASYDAWWEMFPNGINLVFSVSPGDAITSSVTYNGGGNYTLFLNDHTSGKSFSLSEK